MAERVFAKKCGKCRERAVVLTPVPYTVQIDHDGRKYTIVLPALVVPRCGNCGTIALDEEANRQISAAFRQQAGLLSPDQLRRHRIALGLTQQALADLLGVAVSTLSRWENGWQIQQRAFDRFLRAFYALPELRKALAEGDILHLPELQAVSTEKKLEGDPPPAPPVPAGPWKCLQETDELRKRAEKFRLGLKAEQQALREKRQVSGGG